MQAILLNSVTTATTGTGVNVENLTKITVQATVTTYSSGTASVNVQGSNDGENWDTVQCHRTVANDNTQSLVAALNNNLSSATTEMLFPAIKSPYKIMRAVVSGTFNATVLVILHGTKMVRR